MKFCMTLISLMIFSCSEKPSSDTQANQTSGDEPILTILDIGKDYLIDDQHSYIGFKIKYFGFSPVRGRFNDFDGTLFYDPSHLSSLSVSIVYLDNVPSRIRDTSSGVRHIQSSTSD